jgi:hypothetical protein
VLRPMETVHETFSAFLAAIVVASFLVAGCTTSTTSNTNQTLSATSSTATHDAFLEKYLAEYKNGYDSDKSLTIKAWDLTWINSTSARVEWTTFNKTTNVTLNHVGTLILFPTSQDATNYLNAMNRTSYSLASTTYPSVGLIRTLQVTQHRFTKSTYGTKETRLICQNINFTKLNKWITSSL